MGRPIRALITVLLSFAVVIVFATSAAAGGHHSKVDICHWTGHTFVEITVSEQAVPAHLRHGDVMPDEYGDCPDEGNGGGNGGHGHHHHGHKHHHHGPSWPWNFWRYWWVHR